MNLWRPNPRWRERLRLELRHWLHAGPPYAALRPEAAGDGVLALVAETVTETVGPILAGMRQEAAAQGDAAARLQRVLASVDAAILAVSADHLRLYANPGAERLFALPAAFGERVAALQRLPQLLQWVDEAAASGQPRGGRLALPDERTLQVDCAPLAAPPAAEDRGHWPPLAPPLAAAGCVIVARDITATVYLETARRDFIAAVSHELRTPLTSIQGYAELLRDDEELSAAARREFLGVMLDNTARLTRMARDLVTLAALESGTYPFHFAPLDAAGLAAPALAVLEPLARERGCRLALQPTASAMLQADGEALHRALLNLIENAIVHGPGGGLGGAAAGERPAAGLQVTLSGEVAGDQYIFRVRDNGVGIGSADQPRVFERFYRVERSHASLPGALPHGTGLGLALVKHIVKEHGGQVELESALGRGSTFSVHLPLARTAPHGNLP